jgi:hypothetical protein
MIQVKGIELDLERSSDGSKGGMWNLVFTSGLFSGPGVQKFTEPFQFRIKKGEYSTLKGYYIYYNPYNDRIQIIENNETGCQDLGYNIGGFLIRDCDEIVFLYPKCKDDVQYIRNFDEVFDESYEKRKITCDEYEDLCGAFREENFSNDFEIDCPIIGTNEFDVYEFDPEEFNNEVQP